MMCKRNARFFSAAPRAAGALKKCYTCRAEDARTNAQRPWCSRRPHTAMTSPAPVPIRWHLRRAAPLAAVAMLLVAAGPSACVADAPRDRILLISTREVGLRCDGAAMLANLRYEELEVDDHGQRAWRQLAPSEAAVQLSEPMPTVVYVHGNRVASGMDKSTGLAFYHTMARRKPSDSPLRFVIWSWPSTRIAGGPVHDYEVKAARTLPVGWQLAWTIDRLPVETPLALVGYSYGARVVTGALHLLAGGRMNHLALAERAHTERPPIRAALVAAAVDAQWLRPGGFHGLALRQVDQLLLVNNQRDPAMRFYRISPIGQGRPLGYSGLASVGSLGPLAARVRSVDVTDQVGRHHAIGEYLTASGPIGRVLEQVASLPSVKRDDAADGAVEVADGGEPPQRVTDSVGQ